MSKWKPSKSDIQWTENLLAMRIGVWIGDFGIIDLKHEDKSYRWKAITARDVGTAVRIDQVMKKIGWNKVKADFAEVKDTHTEFHYKAGE